MNVRLYDRHSKIYAVSIVAMIVDALYIIE